MSESFADRIGRFLGAKRAVLKPPAWLAATADASQWDVPDLGRAYTHAELYERSAWVQNAVGHVARAAALVPLEVVRRLPSEDEEEIPSHPLELLLSDPNPLETRFQLLQGIVASKLLTGNAYVWLSRGSENEQPLELWLIPSHKIKPVPDKRMFIRGYLYYPEGIGGGEGIALETWEIMHLKRWHPTNPFVGLSPMEALRTTARADIEMSRWNANFFGNDNAKMPGALAFADPIDDTTWARLKDEVRAQHGGVKRSLMMLRGAGKGGVEWINMGVAQKDMQFLEGRDYSKQEIYETLAPGLFTMLSENGNRANAETNRAAFDELAVWPELVALAEAITRDILPAYGDNLVARFEDIRPRDRTLALTEQRAAEAVMTVEEVRAAYYQLPPLGDARDKMLVSEALKGAPPAPAPQGEKRRARRAVKSRATKAEGDEEREPDWSAIEGDAADEIEGALMAQLDEIASDPDTIERAAERVEETSEPLRQTVLKLLEAAVEAGAEAMGADWSLVNEDALAWARSYSYELVRDLNATSRDILSSAIAEWVESGEPFDALREKLEAEFGRRGAVIAATEATRAYAEGNRRAWENDPEVEGWTWQTARDERVCPTCGPLHGTSHAKDDEGAMIPPAHVSCRCWMTPRVRD